MNNSGIVLFKAKGIIFAHDKDGNITGVKGYREGTGVVKSGPDLMGRVFRQCTDLLPCHRVTVKTYSI